MLFIKGSFHALYTISLKLGEGGIGVKYSVEYISAYSSPHTISVAGGGQQRCEILSE